jgi:hypothetical protein
MSWMGHIAYMGDIRKHTKFLLEILKGSDHLEDFSIDRLILKPILKK